MKVKYSDIQHLVIAATLVLTATCYDLVVLAGIPITVLILLECASILCVISRTCKKITVAGLVSAAMFFLIVWGLNRVDNSCLRGGVAHKATSSYSWCVPFGMVETCKLE